MRRKITEFRSQQGHLGSQYWHWTLKNLLRWLRHNSHRLSSSRNLRGPNLLGTGKTEEQFWSEFMEATITEFLERNPYPNGPEEPGDHSLNQHEQQIVQFWQTNIQIQDWVKREFWLHPDLILEDYTIIGQIIKNYNRQYLIFISMPEGVIGTSRLMPLGQHWEIPPQGYFKRTHQPNSFLLCIMGTRHTLDDESMTNSAGLINTAAAYFF